MLATTVNTQRPLPVLEDYELSPLYGFIPHEVPLERLPQSYYQPWENIADRLIELIQSKKLRDEVHQLPLLDVDQLENVREQRRAYQVLGFLSHSYLWGDKDKPTPQSLPAALAVPWTRVADQLGIPPILTYAATDVWNWTLKDKKGPFELENLKTLFTMTGTPDEDWFYIVATAVEMAGGAAMKPLLAAVEAARAHDATTVQRHMAEALTHLQRVAGLLSRMFENCDPAVFYWQIRPFIQGTEHNPALGLLDGLAYEGVNGGERKQFMGTTAGQSSLFPALDIFYGIDHDPNPPSSKTSSESTNGSSSTASTASTTNDSKSLVARKNRHPLLYKMKQYMPGPHRAFLDHLAEVANLRDYVEQHGDANPDLVQVYNASVAQIQEFRSIHIRVATRYVVMQAKRGPPPSMALASNGQPSGPAAAAAATTTTPTPQQQQDDKKNKTQTHDDEADATKDGAGVKGTGGSDLVVFLRGLRDETTASKFA
ncbi:hypothetical protein DFQ26_002720 [Actinomortierella ambigua]|nr:hypothetical protein DFQ26_002720 [Actinomortierella ambigua]